jgi:hypothetical protein
MFSLAFKQSLNQCCRPASIYCIFGFEFSRKKPIVQHNHHVQNLKNDPFCVIRSQNYKAMCLEYFGWTIDILELRDKLATLTLMH